MTNQNSKYDSRLDGTRRLRHAYRGLTVSVLLILLAYGYVSRIGIPGLFTNRIHDRLEETGYDIQFERIRFTLGKGLVADRVVVYADEDDELPTFQARAVAGAFRPARLFRRSFELTRIRIVGGLLMVNVGGPLRVAEDPHVLGIQDMYAVIRMEPEGMRLAEFHAEAGGLRIEGRGFVDTGEDDPETERVPRDGFRDVLSAQRAWLPDLVSEINAVQYQEEAVLQFEFMLYPDDPADNRVFLTAGGGLTRMRGMLFNEWNCAFRYADGTVDIRPLSARFGEHRLEVTARLDLEADRLEARLHSSLPPLYWKNLIPVGHRRHLDDLRIFVDGPLVVDAEIGPVPVGRVWDRINGEVSASGLDLHGVWLEQAEMTVRARTNRLQVHIHQGVVGRGDRKGTVSGIFETDFDALTYSGDMVGHFDPHELIPVLGRATNVLRLIRSMSFREDLPRADGTFSGSYRDPSQFAFRGVLGGSNFLFRGSSIGAFRADVTVKDRHMRMDPIRVTRPEGKLTGVYEQQFEKKWVWLDVRSGIDPKALIRLGEPELEVALRPFRFAGPADIRVKGRVGYGGYHEQTDYRALAQAERLGWRWLLADTGSFTWHATGDRVEISDIDMNLYGGRVTGAIALAGIGTGGSVRYDVEGAARDMRFGDFIRQLKQTEGEGFEGLVTSSFSLRGIAGEEWREHIEGDGRVRIRDGHVFQIPLLGGLSQILGRIYPGLGFATQTDLRTEYEVGDRRVHMDDIRIEGNILSIRGWGHYHLDDDLNFRVQVEPLRRGFLVDAVRFLTFPVSRILQLRLRGTLEEPRWRIEAIPRELMDLFE